MRLSPICLRNQWTSDQFAGMLDGYCATPMLDVDEDMVDLIKRTSRIAAIVTITENALAAGNA